MAGKPSSVDDFNRFVAAIFEVLLEAFPIAADLDGENTYNIAKAVGATANEKDLGLGNPIYEVTHIREGVSFDSMLVSTATWLRDEGFIRSTGSEIPIYGVVLTAQAWSVLTSENDAETSMAAKLKAVARQAGSKAGDAALAQVISHIIATAARLFGAA